MSSDALNQGDERCIKEFYFWNAINNYYIFDNYFCNAKCLWNAREYKLIKCE